MCAYRSYHTVLKQLAVSGTLPDVYKKKIDRSTLWRWKREDFGKYTGYELGYTEILEEFINRKESLTLMKAYLKAALLFSGILDRFVSLKKVWKKNLNLFINTIIRLQPTIDRRIILKLCRISPSVFHYWKNKVTTRCINSPIGLCRKKYPNQLSVEEVKTMKNLLLDERFKFWPVCSIAYYALRENIISASLSTWYLYRQTLGITRPPLPGKKPRQTGIRSDYPNQVWHADITIIKTRDNLKHYIYLLMDNFSKFILNWRIEPFVSGKIRAETIRNAIIKYNVKKQSIVLLTDGGPENVNHEIENFVAGDSISITPLVALRDIPFSNSLIEAHNKLLKYHYLFRQEYENINDLRKLVDAAVRDYNFFRPHISLKGYTPHEVYSGIQDKMVEWKKPDPDLRRRRFMENRKDGCDHC